MRVKNCKCPECYTLREYMLDLTGKDYGLTPAPGHGFPPSLAAVKTACDGSYTCPCEDCTKDKVRASGGRASLPWETDHRAAA